jgi:hypothetical protein
LLKHEETRCLDIFPSYNPKVIDFYVQSNNLTTKPIFDAYKVPKVQFELDGKEP